MGKLTREQVMPIIERLGGIGDKGWTFSEMGLMALISEVEDLVGKPHPDDIAVDKFAAAMKEKLALARAKGYSGWQQISPDELSKMLWLHVFKGDPIDVANFCMFLWHQAAGIQSNTLMSHAILHPVIPPKPVPHPK